MTVVRVGELDRVGGQGRCEVFVKIQNKNLRGGSRRGGGGGVGWGVRSDVNEELKFF